jgi:predicted AAA+ superfamily ATPase
MRKFQRKIYDALGTWANNKQRKPLLLLGARQVGKTYVLETFGKDAITLDLGKDPQYHGLFQQSKDPKKIIRSIELALHKKINLEKDLLILDEVQECPAALASLKYFEQDLKGFRVIASGSHLGLLREEQNFPVGKVDVLEMYPLTFEEFLGVFEPDLAVVLGDLGRRLKASETSPGTSPKTSKEAKGPEWSDELPGVHELLLKWLDTYLAVGGLPEAVDAFSGDHWEAARVVQKRLLIGYESDFAKHSGVVNANHIYHVFRSIAIQLSSIHNESFSRFRFTGVIPKQKGFDAIRGPLTWLTQSRLCLKCPIVKRSEHPLLAHTQENLFRVFYLDVGLLNAAMETPMEVLVSGKLGAYKGFLAENFVAQELVASGRTLLAWQEGQSEIEFLATLGADIVPIEVKSGERSRRAKSLEAYISRYHPSLALKCTRTPASWKAPVHNIPLYAVGVWSKNR